MYMVSGSYLKKETLPTLSVSSNADDPSTNENYNLRMYRLNIYEF
jgi:hypothetical protein